MLCRCYLISRPPRYERCGGGGLSRLLIRFGEAVQATVGPSPQGCFSPVLLLTFLIFRNVIRRKGAGARIATLVLRGREGAIVVQEAIDIGLGVARLVIDLVLGLGLAFIRDKIEMGSVLGLVPGVTVIVLVRRLDIHLYSSEYRWISNRRSGFILFHLFTVRIRSQSTDSV